MNADDSVDVSGDGVPDLLISGYTEGTTDVPSSSGTCTRFVQTLPGTTLLCSTNADGQRVAHRFEQGDTVPGPDAELQDGLKLPRFVHTDASITVLYWSYGGTPSAPVVDPGVLGPVFVFHTIEDDRAVHGTFRIQAENGDPSVGLIIGTLAPSEEPMIIE